MHRHDSSTEVLTQAVVRYAVERMRLDPPPLDKTRPASELRAMAGKTVTAKGIGGLEALRIFADVLGPASISIDHPRFLSFVPAAPTEAAILFDLVVGASSIYGGSWLEGGGLLRKDLSPKPAYVALQKLIRGQWMTRAGGQTDEHGTWSFRGFRGDYVVRVQRAGGAPVEQRFHLGRNEPHTFTVTLP